MKIRKNTILITGGATGIGLGLAELFIKAGNKVIICGRRQDKLDEAKRRFPQLHTIKCDVSKEKEQEKLLDLVEKKFKDMNILINNAGVMRMIDLKTGKIEKNDEVDTNLKAPINLSRLFVPHLMKQKEAAIVNVSSGLAFAPLAITPIYCATKAGLHSFTLSLRHQLKSTSIKVFEVIPPRVDTELGIGDRGGREIRQEDRGIHVSQIANAVIKGIENNSYEISVGMSEGLKTASREQLNEAFQRMNQF